MIRATSLVGLCLFLFCLKAEAQNRYMVFFTDKDASAFSTSNPQQFLSQRAIGRRQRQSIPIVEDDLPVLEAYVNQLETLGAQTFYRTKWMNGVLVQMESNLVPAIEALSFVDHTEYVAPGAPLTTDGSGGGGDGWDSSEMEAAESDFQNEMLGIDQMHNAGYEGQGMLIGVFDEGFNSISQIAAFDHLFRDNRLLYTYDFTSNGSAVENGVTHGTRVLSTLAANSEGELIGAAPGASYILSITEAAGEYRIEEYNWLFATEKADSAGVDLINTSLGYNQFTDPTMDYTQADMDGQTTVITRAANLAASKGIALITSAGNTGLNPNWPIITAPGDSPNVLAVGAVNSARERARISSMGPSADGRIKPDVAALGIATAVLRSPGAVSFSDGTSFASPLITGLAAGLWQAHPELTAIQLLQLIRLSGDRFDDPDNLLGYGIPDFTSAVRIADEIDLPVATRLTVYPNPTNERFINLAFDELYLGTPVKVVAINASGLQVNQYEFTPTDRDNRIRIDLGQQPAGVYLLRVVGVGGMVTKRILKF